MSNWKFTDSTNSVVYRTNENGSCESCIVEVIADWVAEGNVPDPADPVPVSAVSVTPWQIRKAMNALGLRAAVESAVASADQATKDGWEFAQDFRRDNPLIASVAAALGKTPAEIDALFVLAVTL